MKKILFFGATLLLMFASCSKDEDPVIVEESARYYVKYEVTTTTQKEGVNVSVTCKTDKGIQTVADEVTQTKTFSWEGTYGPVSKDFMTNLTCGITENGSLNVHEGIIHARIYVSRATEPFVIKAERTSTGTLTLLYKIDF